MTIELKVGSEFWARQVNGHYGAGGDPLDFTIVGETKTLWKVKRTSCSTDEVKPSNMKKDGSEWEPLPAEDAKKILWLRTNANAIENAVHQVARNSFNGNVNLQNYDTLKAIAELIDYKPVEK